MTKRISLLKEAATKPVTVTRTMLLYLVLTIALSNIAVSISGVAYTTHRERLADHRWCQLFRDLDRPVDTNIKDPVQRKRTLDTVSKIHKLRVEHGCVKA